MVVRWNATRIRAARETMNSLLSPYLLRQYNAVPDDFEALCDEDFRCEYVDGVLIVHSPASPKHEDLGSFLHYLLRGFTSKHRSGTVFSPNLVMQIGERRFCSDVSFLCAEQKDRVQTDRVVGPMDLVIEILSKSTRAFDLDEKLTWYREARVPEIWLVDPDHRQFHVDWLKLTEEQSPGDYQTERLERGRWQSRIVGGFWMDVEWLWADPLPNDFDCLNRILEST